MTLTIAKVVKTIQAKCQLVLSSPRFLVLFEYHGSFPVLNTVLSCAGNRCCSFNPEAAAFWVLFEVALPLLLPSHGYDEA